MAWRQARQAAINFGGILIVISTVGMLVYLCWGLLNREMPLTNKDAMMLVIGVLLAKYSDIVAWFFGGSADNKRQTETIETLAATAKTAGEALTANVDPGIELKPGESVTVAADADSR